MISGIIKITNTVNGYIYIGYSCNAKQRIVSIKAHLKRGIYYSKYLQADWNRYGEENFNIEIVEECSEDELVARKQYYMDVLQPTYNICEKSFASSKDVPRSERALANMLQSAKKRSVDPVWIKNLAEAREKMYQDPVWINKNKDVGKRNAQNPEWHKKLSDGQKRAFEDPKKRKKHLEAMKKLSANPEWRKNNSKQREKNYQNPEWMKKILETKKRLREKKLLDAQHSVNPTETSSREK